jgi:hypothetical protein
MELAELEYFLRKSSAGDAFLLVVQCILAKYRSKGLRNPSPDRRQWALFFVSQATRTNTCRRGSRSLINIGLAPVPTVCKYFVKAWAWDC